MGNYDSRLKRPSLGSGLAWGWRRSARPAPWVTAAIFAAAALGAFHAAFLARYPSPFVDEAWMASRAWGFLRTGLNFGPLDAGAFERLPGYWTFFPLIPTLMHAAVMHFTGPLLLGLRAVSLGLGLAFLVAIYVISNELGGARRQGVIAVLLAATSFAFTTSAHLVRSDVLVAAFAFSSIALSLVGWRRRQTVLHFAGGLLLGLAFEVHMNAVVFSLPILALYGCREGWRGFWRPRFVSFAVGAGLALAAYLWLHVLRYPDTYFAMGGDLGRTHLPPAFASRVTAVIDSLVETVVYLATYTQFRFLAIVPAAVFMFRDRRAVPRDLLILVAAGIASFALFVRAKTFYYAILVAPFIDIYLAAVLESILRSGSGKGLLLKITSRLAYLLILVSVVVTFGIVVLTPRPGDAETVAARIEAVAPDGAVMGSQNYWFPLYEHKYFSWQHLATYMRLNPGSDLYAAMQAMKPDVFVIDDELRNYIIDDRGLDQRPQAIPRFFWERRLSKPAVLSFLAQRGTLADQVETAAYGRVEIYAIHWDGQPAGATP